MSVMLSLDLSQLLVLSLMMMVRVEINVKLFIALVYFSLVAVIGFVPDAHTITEGVNQFANLSVELIFGQLGREVIVNFNTQNGSAMGITFDYIP